MMRYRGDLTADGLIPFRAFWLFVAAIPSVLALRAESDARAVALAIGARFGDPKVARQLADLHAEAWHGGR
jgi:hypothetical protein